MPNWNDPHTRSGLGGYSGLQGRTASREGYDIGLRKYMLSI